MEKDFQEFKFDFIKRNEITIYIHVIYIYDVLLILYIIDYF